MARIGILNCSNATQELGCSSVVCLADLRGRKGAFASYPKDENLTLVGIINCPGCPTLTGPEKLLGRIRGMTEFNVDAIHMSFCVKALCPFAGNYIKALREAFPQSGSSWARTRNIRRRRNTGSGSGSCSTRKSGTWSTSY